MSSRKPKKYKLLLDEGLPLPLAYPETNRYYDIKHIAQTRYRGSLDIVVFQIAKKEDRFPVVFNTKHFKPLITDKSISVISLSINLTTREADLKICKALKELKNNEIKGYLISITKNGVRKDKFPFE